MSTIASTRMPTRMSEPASSRLLSVMAGQRAGIDPRARNSRGFGLSPANTVAEPPHGLDQIARRPELRSQPLHVHVHGAGLNVRRGFPYHSEQVCSPQNPATAFGECQQ